VAVLDRGSSAGPLAHRRRIVPRLAAALVAGCLGACAATDDLAHRYGLGETRTILLLPYPAYLEARLDPAGGAGDRGRWLPKEDLERLLDPLGAAETCDPPAEARPAYALVFCPEEPVACRTLVLDQYLNLWPGFRYLGETYEGLYADPGKEWKRSVLARIAELPGGLKPLKALLEETRPEAPGGEPSGPEGGGAGDARAG
jgi:hypothetical protein